MGTQYLTTVATRLIGIWLFVLAVLLFWTGATAWCVLGGFCTVIGLLCMTPQKFPGIAFFATFVVCMATLLVFSQIRPQYRTWRILRQLDPQSVTGVKLQGEAVGDPRPWVEALNQAEWVSDHTYRYDGFVWVDNPPRLFLEVAGRGTLVLELGVAPGEGVALRRNRNESNNAGFVGADGLRPLLQAAGYEVVEGRWTGPPGE